VGVVILKVSEPYEIDRACVNGACKTKIFDRDVYTFRLGSTPEKVDVKVKVMLCHQRTIFNICVKADFWDIWDEVYRDSSTSLCGRSVCVSVSYRTECPGGSSGIFG